MIKPHRFSAFLCAAMVFSMLTAGCSESADEVSSSVQETGAPMQQMDFMPNSEPVESTLISLAANGNAYTTDLSTIFTERDLSGSYDTITAEIVLSGTSASVEGTGASANGSVITITDEGTYRISGTLDDGQILVNSEGKVQLLLDGADITCSDSSPIYIQNAKKVFITTAENSANSVTDGSTYVYANETDNEPDAAIFSTDELTLNGSGSLTVNANYNEGITCKDELVITSGTIEISAPGNGIKGKDYVAIGGGSISVTAGADGIKSSNAVDAGFGFVCIENGSITVDAQEDGIQAETELIVTGGSLALFAGGGIANAQSHQNDDFRGGWEDTSTETDTTVSTKALKAGTLLCIEGGSFVIDSADDALHTNGNLYVSDGSLQICAGGDAIHADGQAEFAGGSITVSNSYEGVEAADILVSGGTLDITCSDDGFNASDGTAQGAMGTISGCALEITGGSIHVNADGDGLDSNGTMLILGGTVLVDGPTNNGNGAIDGNGGITCSGGTLIAAGSSGMAEYPSGTQNCIVLTLSSNYPGGTELTVLDSSGNTVLSFTPAKSFQSVVCSSPDLIIGETYSLCLDGTETESITLSDAVSFAGMASGGMMGGPGGHGGGFGGHGGNFEMPDDMSIPDPGEMPDGGMQPPGGMGGGMQPPGMP